MNNRLTVTETKASPALGNLGHSPDAVVVAQSIVIGVEPPDLYWNLKPHCKTLNDGEEDASRDYYLRPRQSLQESWPLEFLVIVCPTIAVEFGIQKDPAYQARVIEQALLDSLRMLNRIVEDGIRQTNPFNCSLDRVTRNSRLRTRLAVAVHDELAELLNDYSQLSTAFSRRPPQVSEARQGCESDSHPCPPQKADLHPGFKENAGQPGPEADFGLHALDREPVDHHWRGSSYIEPARRAWKERNRRGKN